MQRLVLKWLEGFIVSIFSIFAPIQSILATSAVMIMSDLITGVMAAKKRGEPITSAGLRRTISKLFTYELAIMFAFLAEHYISNVLPFVKMASAMVSLVELKSIYENLNSLSSDNLLKGLINKIGSDNQTK